MPLATLFQDEADEEDAPSLFQQERDDGGGFFPLQDEPDEPDEPPTAIPAPAAAFLFQDEVDDADSDSSSCLGDDEHEGEKSSNTQLVQLSFATLTRFMESQLCNASGKSTPAPVVKKRHYNNERRAAKAEASKRLRSMASSTTHRIPRNDPATLV